MAESNMCGRIKTLLNFITSGLIEKDEAAKLALLAGIAGESVFFLGPPGTAKSLISRRLKNAFKGENGESLNYFEYLMNQFSTPDEVFGPVSLKSLENDEYKRIVDGYLPSADFVFLDEIWKASPAIHNTLLTVINEKKFHNGNEVLDVPLKVLISASNELPAKGQGLEALWDRFLIRLTVGPVKNVEDFKNLICAKKTESDLNTSEIDSIRIAPNELLDWQEKIDNIEVPDSILNVIIAIKQELALKNNQNATKIEDGTDGAQNLPANETPAEIYVSDRRWKKIVHVLKTSAFLNGRDEVDLMDASLIQRCIGDDEEQMNSAKEIVKKCIEQNGIELSVSIDEIQDDISDFGDRVLENLYEKVKGSYCPKNLDGAVLAFWKDKLEGEYSQIKEKIVSENEKVNSYKGEKEESLKNNLFAAEEIHEVIFEKIGKLGVDLDYAMSGLECIKDMYTNPSVIDASKVTRHTNSAMNSVPNLNMVKANDYMLSDFPITQSQWKSVMNNNPFKTDEDDEPATNLSLLQMKMFCNELSKKENLTPVYDSKGKFISKDNSGYRLPTEGELLRAANNGTPYTGAIRDVSAFSNTFKMSKNGKRESVKNETMNELGFHFYDSRFFEVAMATDGKHYAYCFDSDNFRPYDASFTTPSENIGFRVSRPL